MTTTTPETLNTRLMIQIIQEEGYCHSNEEATVIVETIVAEEDNENRGFENALCEYLDISSDVAARIMSRAINYNNHDDDDDDEFDSSENGDSTSLPDVTDDDENDDDDDDADDGSFIGEGECELCERFIQLTQHHLVPRSTWPRIEARLLRALETDPQRAAVLVGEGLEHLLPSTLLLSSEKVGKKHHHERIYRHSIKGAVRRTSLVCRSCHNAIHKAHDNMTLALEYNTIEKLLSDDRIASFSKWANKQRVAKNRRS